MHIQEQYAYFCSLTRFDKSFLFFLIQFWFFFYPSLVPQFQLEATTLSSFLSRDLNIVPVVLWDTTWTTWQLNDSTI